MAIVANPQIQVDVDLLMKLFSDVIPDGRVITHDQIEAAIRLPRTKSRYKTVTKKWRRNVFEERGVYLDGKSAEGRGFVALTPNEMVRFSNRGVRSAGRALRKMITIAATPNDEQLSDGIRRYRQVLMVATERIAQQHRASLRDMTRALAPMKQLPRKTD